MIAAARKANARLIPVDSEHNAIFQVLGAPETVSKLIITASGGPFLRTSVEDMRRATPEQAIRHPNWSMGPKISVDSATLFNKGLELIEAAHLFAIDPERIEILVHPQSVIHSMVAYQDGSVLAQLGEPDMRTPIACALAWPDRVPVSVPVLDLIKRGPLTFEEPDLARFPALDLCRSAFAAGAGATAVLNAANEVAVEAFLHRRVGFLDIAIVVDKVLELLAAEKLGDIAKTPSSFEEVVAADAAGRRAAKAIALTGQAA
jgi:1-deoxy-D-xylulose-5-phosphate reductoisomerase